MKIAFVCDNVPLTGNLNGAAALSYAHLRGLMMALPEASFHLVVFEQHAAYRFSATEITAEFRHVQVAVTKISFNGQAGSKGRKKQLFGTGISPLLYFYPFLTKDKLMEIGSILGQIRPDLIWTEHLVPNLAIRLVKPNAPVVYSHHDFLWKVIGLRQRDGGWKKRLLNQVRKRAERQIILSNNYFVGGSGTELLEISQINHSAITAFLPAAYKPVDIGLAEEHSSSLIRIVHLGTMAAIANRIGLERFLTVCWPSLHAQFPDIKFILIGDMGSAVSEGLRPLLLQPNLQSLGFVPDLPEAMRPYDLFIIPYEFDTGTRTRLPLALNYKQLLVVHKNACRGIDGLKHMENCLMADSLEEMTSLIGDVLSGRIDYKPIADRGKMLFGQAFTVEGQLPRMKTFLSAIFGQ